MLFSASTCCAQTAWPSTSKALGSLQIDRETATKNKSPQGRPRASSKSGTRSSCLPASSIAQEPQGSTFPGRSSSWATLLPPATRSWTLRKSSFPFLSTAIVKEIEGKTKCKKKDRTQNKLERSNGDLLASSSLL